MNLQNPLTSPWARKKDMNWKCFICCTHREPGMKCWYDVFDNIYITATNLTLNTKECNPDKDIITTKPTIQIQGAETNIYDQTGAYILTMPLTRLQWLWERYNQNQTHHMIHFLNPPPHDFATKILWLTQRYVTNLPKRKPKKIIQTTTTNPSTS